MKKVEKRKKKLDFPLKGCYKLKIPAPEQKIGKFTNKLNTFKTKFSPTDPGRLTARFTGKIFIKEIDYE